MDSAVDDDLLQWLLDSDPAIRWRVLRDLTGATDTIVARQRRRVATEGWGARLLAAQNPDGGWGDGVYFHDSNDMLKQFRSVIGDGRDYYLLAYGSPTSLA